MQSPSSSSSSNTTKTTSGSNKMLNPSKSTSIKTKSSTVLNLGHPKSSTTTNKDLETSLEIEKISKKISEHADALYRTWKSHGLAPTEILDLYAVEAGVPAAAITDDKSTEDLQKLVNSFVNKDKEQRGVKTNLQSKTKIITPKQEVSVTPKVIEHKIQKLATPSSSSSALLAQQQLKGNILIEPSQTVTAIKKSTPSIKSTNFLIKNGPSSSIDITDANSAGKVTKLKSSKPGLGGGVALINDHHTINASNITQMKPNKPLDIEIDFNLNLDLNLDVHKLTQQQSNNLQKIKELLKEPQKNPTATITTTTTSTNSLTKIPSVNLEKTAGKSKEIKVKKSSLENSKKINSLEENKQNEERKLGDSAQVIRKIGNKLKVAEELAATTTSTTPTKAHDLNLQQNQSIETLKKSKNLVNNTTQQEQQHQLQPTNKKRTLLTTGSSSSPLIAHTQLVGAAITNGNLLIDNNYEKALLNATNFDDNLLHNNKENSSIKVQKSSSSSGKTITKSTKFKEKSDKSLKETKDTPLAKILDSKETKALELNVATTAAVTAAAAVVTESQIMDLPQHSSSDSSNNIMPTPTKLKSTRPLSNGQEKSLRSPFLTRGSVAERVLIFEKCPDVRNSFLNIKRPDKAEAPPKSLLKVKLHATPPPPPEQNSLQREIRNTKSVYIPRFYFPHGKPQPTIALERTLRGILSAFDTFPNNQVTKDELPRILKICGLPFYWRMPVMVFCQQGNSGLVERQRFVDFWKQMNVYCHEDASRFVYILSRGQRMRSYIMPEDLAPLVQDVVDTHPGLAFLKEATEFHSRYVHTVIARIFYSVNRSWSGRISISELKRSDLLEILVLLEEEDDINQIMAFFSYEHFYVIYCKFWELDKDHDLLISQDDLARHSDHALSTRIVERIFSGCVTRSDNKKNPDDEPKMSYTDFVWFLLSEEDKRTSTAIEYWFRCMDIDGDGQLSMYELEYFYEEQQQRMESIGIESLPFEDCLCQMLDMIKPRRRDAVTLSDLKNCKMTHVFFDTFFNLEKYLDHEQRDPFASQRDEYTSDWERFAAQEYELLITEEND